GRARLRRRRRRRRVRPGSHAAGVGADQHDRPPGRAARLPRPSFQPGRRHHRVRPDPACGEGGGSGVNVSERTFRRWWWPVVVVLLMYVIGFVLQLLAFHSEVGSSWGSGGAAAGVAFVAMTLLFPAAGALIIRRQPRNTIGWVLMGIGLAWGLDHLCTGFASFFWL